MVPPRTTSDETSEDDLTLRGLVDELGAQLRRGLSEAQTSGRFSREMLAAGIRDVWEAVDPEGAARREARAPEPAWQMNPESDLRTVFRGAAPKVYRLTVRAGTVRVWLDGKPTDTLYAPAAIDVEAALIQVEVHDGPAEVVPQLLSGVAPARKEEA